MSFTDRTRTDDLATTLSDTIAAQKTSPWPFALRVTSAALLLILVFCFAFPNG